MDATLLRDGSGDQTPSLCDLHGNHGGVCRMYSKHDISMHENRAYL